MELLSQLMEDINKVLIHCKIGNVWDDKFFISKSNLRLWR